MNCRQIQKQLSEDLSSRFDQEVSLHLNDCPECRRLSIDLVELEELSQSLGRDFRVPPGFKSQTFAKLASSKPSRFPFLHVGLGCTLILAVFVGILSFWRDQSGPVEYDSAGEISNELHVPEFREGTPSYVDVVIDEKDGEEMILRLPFVIEIRQTAIQGDSLIHNVSH